MFIASGVSHIALLRSAMFSFLQAINIVLLRSKKPQRSSCSYGARIAAFK
jgi:hypothetical protein